MVYARQTLFPITLAAIAALLVSIWIPEITHYYVTVPKPSPEMVRELRAQPDDRFFAQNLIVQPFFGVPVAPGKDPGRSASSLVQQQLDAAGIGTTLPDGNFDEEVIEHGIAKLDFAGLIIPDIYTRAYEVTGQLDFLRRAARFLVTFSRYERKQWLPTGFLWNDHAIAARIGVLARFWRSYRHSEIYDASIAQEVLWHASRCAEMLADPEQFTYATNHGVMQNLALLQFSAAFPAFSKSPSYARLAMDRLTSQFKYYVSHEGIILEHSSGYHVVGVQFIRMAIGLAELNDLAVPPEWRNRYARAIDFMEVLTRPDGSLPIYGDTKREPRQRIGDTRDSATGFHLYPVSGYAIWNAAGDAGGSHSLVTWSHFPDHGHVVAHEMSLLVWSRGRSWITGVGYWPYALPERQAAVGWRSANAPHWLDEGTTGVRTTKLLKFGRAPGVVVLDLTRSDATGRHLRRQVTSINGSVWIVLDIAVTGGAETTFETLWTFAPGLAVHRDESGFAILTDGTRNVAMHLTIAGGPATETAWYSGSHQPFAGWVVQSGKPRPSPSVLVQPHGHQAWSTTIFSVVDGDSAASATPVPAIFEFHDAEAWKASGSHAGRAWSARRVGDALVVKYAGEQVELSLTPAPVADKQRRKLRAALAQDAERFDSDYHNLVFYRKRFTLAVLALLLAQELTFAALGKMRRPPLAIAHMRLLSLAGWLAVAAWAHLIYFP